MQTHLQLLAFHNRLPKALRITGSDITAPMPQVYQLQYASITIRQERGSKLIMNLTVSNIMHP